MTRGPLELSICIPTYNFGPFIAETVESILRQLRPGMEVVVLDSGSTDSTETTMTRLQSQNPCIRYVRAPDRFGIDKDMAEVVRLAQGKFCWLFSADDVMADGAIDALLNELRDPHDVYLCQHSNAAIDMVQLKARHPVLELQEPTSFELSDSSQRTRYFKLAVTTEAFYSFMSGLIVRKSTWDSVNLNPEFVGTCWAHVARLFELIPLGLRVRYLPWVLVHRRGDNDSFADQGIAKRYALAIEGFDRLGAFLLGGDPTLAEDIRRVIRNEFPARVFLRAKYESLRHSRPRDVEIIDQLVRITYPSAGGDHVIQRAIYRFVPAAAYVHLQQIYRRVRRVAARQTSRPPASHNAKQ